MPIGQRAALSGVRPMTDPRFHDLTELSRRMTSSLDLRALTEDLVSWAIRETGAATAAIALWDREENVLTALTRPGDRGSRPEGAVGRDLRGPRGVPATRRVLDGTPARSASRSITPSDESERAGLAPRTRAERGPGPAAGIAWRGDRDDGDRAGGRRVQRGRRRLLPAALRHGRERGRERQAPRRAAVDADPVPVADRAAAGGHLPGRSRDRRDARSSAPRSRSCSGSPRRSGWRAPTPGSVPSIPTIANALARRYAAAHGDAGAVPRRVSRRVGRRGRALGGRPHGDPAATSTDIPRSPRA